MGTVLYLDCASGASGDMLMGALIELGIPIDDLRAALGPLLPPGTQLRTERVMRSGIAATGFSVIEPPVPGAGQASPAHTHAHEGHGHTHTHESHALSHPHGAHSHPHPHDGTGHHHHGGHAEAGALSHTHHHRPLQAIYDLIEASALAARTKARARTLYERLGRAESEIHQTPLDTVHLHEVGALDSVVDIVGVVWAIETLGVDRVVASPMNVGGGRVRTAHGLLPVPAPATLRLLDGAPVFSDGTPFELLTPTGALLVTGHATAWGPMPAMTIRRVGYGAGGRELPSHPNVIRAVLGEEDRDTSVDRVVVIETNVDDMNPQLLGSVMDELFAHGALDVFYTPVQMKKNRPGTLVTVVAPPDRREAMMEILFRETTTIGIRHRETVRECLERESVSVQTTFGTVRIKVARRAGMPPKAAPEFDDCVRLARQHGAAVRDVQAAAMRAYDQRLQAGAEAPRPGEVCDAGTSDTPAEGERHDG